jgi:hypothetical protein
MSEDALLSVALHLFDCTHMARRFRCNASIGAPLQFQSPVVSVDHIVFCNYKIDALGYSDTHFLDLQASYVSVHLFTRGQTITAL